MANYPSIDFTKGTQVTPRQSIQMDTASDGSMRGVELHESEVYDLTIEHDNLSESDAETIESFFTTNKTSQIDVSWRGDTYNCYFAGKPSVAWVPGDKRKVVSRLVGNRSDGN